MHYRTKKAFYFLACLLLAIKIVKVFAFVPNEIKSLLKCQKSHTRLFTSVYVHLFPNQGKKLCIVRSKRQQGWWFKTLLNFKFKKKESKYSNSNSTSTIKVFSDIKTCHKSVYLTMYRYKNISLY